MVTSVVDNYICMHFERDFSDVIALSISSFTHKTIFSLLTLKDSVQSFIFTLNSQSVLSHFISIIMLMVNNKKIKKSSHYIYLL